MRNTILFIILIAGLILSSCFTYSVDYGNGPQKHVETEEINNHYFLYGLVGLNVEAPAEPKSGTKDYRVIIEHTFLDGLLRAITFGIYTPTTTVIVE